MGLIIDCLISDTNVFLFGTSLNELGHIIF